MRGRPARCHTTWTVATAPRSSSSVSASTSSISLSGGAVVARQGNVGAGRRDAHGRPGDRLHEVDAVARALEHLAAAGRLVGEPRAPRRRAEHAHGEQAERALGEEVAHVGQPVDRAPLVADRAHDPGALDRLRRSRAHRRDRARRASRGRRGGRARAPRSSPRGGGAAASARARRRAGRARAATPSRRTPRRRSPRPPRRAAPDRGRRRRRPPRRARSGVSRCVSAIQPQPIRPILMPPPRHS